MHISAFDYDLPSDLIAQEPLLRRDASRLLCLHRASSRISHHAFTDLPSLLSPHDLLVLNDTRVIPAKLRGTKEGPGVRVEVLLARRVSECDYEALVRPGRRVRPGDTLSFPCGRLRARVVRAQGRWRTLTFDAGPSELPALLEEAGEAPLPPYIRRPNPDPADRDRYQTVYAQKPGAIAAPTAGLHFTEELLARIEAAGIAVATLTLHVGWGTFAPIEVEQVEDHWLPPEPYRIPGATLRACARARASGGRIVAVGTTSVRALESLADVAAGSDREGETTLVIHPPHSFRHVDAMVTNFHLPRSSLFVLVAAFAGLPLLRAAYADAVAQRYRFYSYGDAMVIL